MEKKISLSKQSFIESINNYKTCKAIFQKYFSVIKQNPKYSNNILKYLDLEKDEKLFHLLFILFFQNQKWINPDNINLGKYSKHFQFKQKDSHDKFEQAIIKCINTKNLMKLYIYWHFYVLIIFYEILNEKDNIKNISGNSLNLIDVENILYQNNIKIINLYKSKSITTPDLIIFLYIYLFWLEYLIKFNFNEKSLKINNNILFSLFFDLLEKIGKEIFANKDSLKLEEMKSNVGSYFSFLEEIKINEFINNDYNIIILLGNNIIQNFMVNLLKNINPKTLENAYPSYSLRLSDFFANFLKFRFDKSKLMDFMLNNIKKALINLKYFETEKDRILNDIFIQNFLSDLIQKIFSYEDKKLNQPNFNSFLFNGINSKISFNMNKMSLDDNLIIFSFLIKSNINDKNSFSEKQPLICFNNNKGECVFQAFLKKQEQKETDKGDSKIKISKKVQYSLIIKFNNKVERIIKEFNYLEPNITYLVCFHLNYSFISIKLYPINGINSKILSGHMETKYNFEEQNLSLNIGFDNSNNKNEFFSGYIGYFQIFKLYNMNKNKIDYENSHSIVDRILLLKEYYKYIIYYLKDPELDYNSEISLDYLKYFKNKNDNAKTDLIYDINKECKNYYKCILFLSPELFKLANIKENDNIKNFIIPTIPGICENQKEYFINEINITFVRFENSKEIFLMKNGLKLFCLQFEYHYQFASYYNLFLKEKLLGEITHGENIEFCLKLIKSTINNILLLLSKYIIDLKISNFFTELKQIFSILITAIKELSSIDCIIDSIFHQLGSIFIIICEQIVLTYNINYEKGKKLYEENNDIKFLISFRDSIIDILLSKDLYKLCKNSKFMESLFDKVFSIIESNNAKDICSSNPNIFKKALSFVELVNEHLMKFQPDWKIKSKEKKGSIILLNSFMKLIKGLITRKKHKIEESIPFKLLVSYCLRENSINDFNMYIFFPLIKDLLNEGYSLDENDISDLIKYFNEVTCTEINDNFQENEKFELSKLIISILFKSIFEKNNKKNFNNFCSEIKQLDLNDTLFKFIINEILNIFSINMDIKTMPAINNINYQNENNKNQNKASNININSIENFDFNSFFNDLFEFVLVLIKKTFTKREISINPNQNNIEENPKISKISMNISQNKKDRIVQEIINLIFFIEEMINAQINNNNIQLPTLLCLLNLIELIHIIVFDEKLIELFYGDKFILLFKSLMESCLKSKIIYTNYYLNPYEKPSTLLKTIPETILDILIKLYKSEKVKNQIDENSKFNNNMPKNDIISLLNEIFLINLKNIGQKDDESIRSLFYYNDLYRYFFSKKITNVDNELKSINKNKYLVKNSSKFGDDFKYIFNVNKLLIDKRKKFNFNFITLNLEKIYLYKHNTESGEYPNLCSFLDKLLQRIIKEHDFLYNIDKGFFFKSNSEYPVYNTIKSKIERMISSKKYDYLDINIFMDLNFGNKEIDGEYINSGLCENIKDSNKKNKIKIKKESNKSSTDIASLKEQKIKKPYSCKDIENSPLEVIEKSSRSVQNDDNHSMHTKSFSSLSDLENINEEELKNNNIEINSNFSEDLNNDSFSESYHTTANEKENKESIFINNSESSTLSAQPTNKNINIYKNNKDKDSFSSSSSTIKKKQLEDDINCNFLNELDSVYLFNVKRDLMKNIFSLNFLDTIFYEKTFIKLRKIFFQQYESKLESKIEDFPNLSYPTKIKNFSNGLEPSLFVKPYNEYYANRTFSITHEYFENYMKDKKIKYKNENISLIDKQLTIPTKEITRIYKCELISINRALYGKIIYSKSGNYLFFEQQKFDDIYKKNINSYNYLGLFSYSSIKFREKETQKCSKKKSKSNKLFHKNKQILILLSDIEEIVEKRVLLMWQGLEIYLKDGRSYFFNFLHEDKYKDFLDTIIKNDEINQIFHRKNYLTKNINITEAWKKDIITTYEYLLLINKYSSRCLNDPSQYYVFPWLITHFNNLLKINSQKDVLLTLKMNENNNNNKDNIKEEKEEKSEEQKLLESLRDLKYPLSLQNETARTFAQFRYTEESESSHFKYHLGTHYSTSPYIYYYLMRQEPYNALLIKLQNYQQENPNRMFVGIKETADILESGNDNRELIPEFYSKIEFFLNLNYSYFGQRSTDNYVNNVIIDFMKKTPNSPLFVSDYVHFIVEHRNLLNSDLININLDDWINNIFGVGQYPAEKLLKGCCNIFRKTSYEDKMNLNRKLNNYKKKKKKDKKYTTSIIRLKTLNNANLILSFGQTPSKTFLAPHPKKEINKKDEANSLALNKKNSSDEDDTLSYFSHVLRPNKDNCKVTSHCIYFDINLMNNKIFALSQNYITIINSNIGQYKNSDLSLLTYQTFIKIPRIKFFANLNMKGIDADYYIYKPKYAFSSFKSIEYIDYLSRKESKISKGSKISKESKSIISEKNFNFNNYYKNLFQSMFSKKSPENQTEETIKFIQCRYIDNSFKIFKVQKIKNLKKKEKDIIITSSYSFLCENFVSSCCTISSNQFLTGLDNGKLIRWNIIKEENDKLEIEFDKNIQAHNGRINAIEINQKMGLIITCGKDNLVQIRKLYNLELLTPIKIKKKYVITMAKVSPINFLYIMCFDMKEKKSIIYGYTLTGIRFAKNKGGVYCNIDFTRSGNIVSLLDHKKLCILNSYDLTKKENVYNENNYTEDLNELKNLEGATWLEYNYYVSRPDSLDSKRINNAIIYTKKEKNKDDFKIFYYEFKDGKIFE